jgi:M6 family metalloprotease-like protein
MHKRIFCLLLFLFLIHVCFSGTASAVPAAPDIFEIMQPNGHVFQVRLKGDEWNNRVETVEGYSVKKDTDGYWYYIRSFERDMPVVSNTYAHEVPLAGIRKHIRPEKRFLQIPFRGNPRGSERGDDSEAVESEPFDTPLRSSTVSTFNGNILFILVEFTDRAGTHSEASFASFITNDITDYFDKASYGNVTLSSANESFGTANNGVVGWVNVGYPHPNTGSSVNDNNRQLTRDAILAADQHVDFLSYDTNGDRYVDADELAVVIIAAGYENSYSSSYSPKVWGHRWSLGWGAVDSPEVDGVRVADSYNGGGYAQFGEIHRSSSSNAHQATMGIMVHELGHLIFGLPDLYDIDGSSNGIGAFGVMGSGSWGKANSDTYSGETPVLPSAWSRYNRGWVAGTESSGAASIEAAGSSSADSINSAYKLPKRIPREYFLVENRQPLGYDRGLERWLGSGFGGLALWHIDETKGSNASECAPPSNCSTNHYWVALEQADGNWDLEENNNRGNTTDLWYSGNNSTFDNISTPDSNLYDGTTSDVSVSGISASGSSMTATLTSPVSTVYAENFESGALGTEWSTSNTNEGRIRVTTDYTPHGGEYHLAMDDSVNNGTYSLNELVLTVDLSGQTGVMMGFFHRELYDENNSMPASFTGSHNSDGVAISDDGSTWYKIQGLTSAEGISFSYKQFSVDLDSAIASAGISYTSTFQIKFQHYDNAPICDNDTFCYYDGFAFDDIWIMSAVLSCSDNDRDGYGNPGDASCPNGPQTDCDDNDILEYPNQTWYEDLDGDGYSSGNTAVQCERPVNHYVPSELTATSGDCNDGNGSIHPGAAEVCDGVDNDCNAGTADGSGESAPDNTLQDGVCAGSKQSCTGGSWTDDYSGVSGYEATETTCDSLDNDCDNQTDEGLTSTFYIDGDGDGFGDENDTGVDACIQPDSYAVNNIDCDDSDANIYPGGPPARINNATPSYYGSLQAAYGAAGGGKTVQSKDRILNEDITINLDKTVTLEGGYDCSYTVVSGVTTIKGNMTVTNGTIVIGDFVIE